MKILAYLLAAAAVSGMFTLALAGKHLNPCLAWAALALLAAGLIGLGFLQR